MLNLFKGDKYQCFLCLRFQSPENMLRHVETHFHVRDFSSKRLHTLPVDPNHDGQDSHNLSPCFVPGSKPLTCALKVPSNTDEPSSKNSF